MGDVTAGRRILTALALAATATAASSAARAQDTPLPPDDGAWELNGDVGVGGADGAPALLLRSGSAIRTGLAFSDGTIEFEMRPTDRRAFLGVVFRAEEDGTGEDVYLRLHKGGLPDAVQYTPDWGGRGQWQIYHGADATAAARFRPGEWQRVRIEVAGSQAAVFVGDAVEPQLVADHLRTGIRSGALAFWGNQPGATADDPWTAEVRDIVVRPGRTTYGFSPPAGEEPPPGVISGWAVAGPFARDGEDVLTLPSVPIEWRRADASGAGVVELDRHVGRVEGAVSYALGGVRIRSGEARTVRLRLGFSDDLSVFLNGRLLASYRNAFSTNFPRRQGLLLPEQASVYLPLDAGENELVLAVSEIFGGWGFLGRIEERDGVVVAPLD